jgi:hypothetical protein
MSKLIMEKFKEKTIKWKVPEYGPLKIKLSMFLSSKIQDTYHCSDSKCESTVCVRGMSA